jgi:hypothetical protein
VSRDLDAAQTLRDLLTNPQMRDTATFKDLTLGELRAAFLLAATSDPAPLDAAWNEAEAALPEGWWLHTLHAWSFGDMAYRAEAASAGSSDYFGSSDKDRRYGTRTYQSGPTIAEFGPTPAAALQALAAKLRDTTGREPSAT